ncbi:hypothetical protein EBT25_08810 [bacterium]|nr:hypothetical protein [bacterium]
MHVRPPALGKPLSAGQTIVPKKREKVNVGSVGVGKGSMRGNLGSKGSMGSGPASSRTGGSEKNKKHPVTFLDKRGDFFYSLAKLLFLGQGERM